MMTSYVRGVLIFRGVSIFSFSGFPPTRGMTQIMALQKALEARRASPEK